MKRSLLSLLMVLISWDTILHNCDPLKPWTNDLSRYSYRVAMRYVEGWQTEIICDENGQNCYDILNTVYNPCDDGTCWSPWQDVLPSTCAAGRCAGVASDAWMPGPGEVLVYEVEGIDRAENGDCGPDPSGPF